MDKLSGKELRKTSAIGWDVCADMHFVSLPTDDSHEKCHSNFLVLPRKFVQKIKT